VPPDLEVDVDPLRRCAADLTRTSAHVATGTAQGPPLVVAGSGWLTAGALLDLQAAADRQFGTLAEAIAATSRRLTQAVDDYQGADGRAAARLRAVG
jgi:hypothetical protein